MYFSSIMNQKWFQKPCKLHTQKYLKFYFKVIKITQNTNDFNINIMWIPKSTLTFPTVVCSFNQRLSNLLYTCLRYIPFFNINLTILRLITCKIFEQNANQYDTEIFHMIFYLFSSEHIWSRVEHRTMWIPKSKFPTAVYYFDGKVIKSTTI